jgi:ATP-dependent RNA helicase DDX10/DBP4
MSKEKAPKPRLLRRRKELNEIEQIQAHLLPPNAHHATYSIILQERITQQAPPPGSNPLAFDKSDATVETAGYAAARLFAELPLSFKTQSALKKANFITMTDVQRATIPHALVGRDVMGSAKTGNPPFFHQNPMF